MKTAQAVAKVTRLFGPDGTVAAVLYDGLSCADPDLEEPLYAIVDSLAVPLFLERFERRGRGGALMRFSDLDTPSSASLLLGCELYDALPSAVPSADYGTLTGYSAVLAPGVTGTVEGIAAAETNPLFVIDVSGREVLVPVADEFVAGIDDSSRTVRFVLPAGLLDLYLD